MEFRREVIQMSFGRNTPMWLSLSAAAGLIDVSEQDVLRRAVPWQAVPEAHRVRFRLLALDPDAKRAPRFFAPDLEALLSSPEGHDQVNGVDSGSGIETKGPRHKLVRRGIYRSTKSGVLFERLHIEGSGPGAR